MKKIYTTSLLLLSAQFAFANELDKMGDFFVSIMGCFAFIAFLFISPFIFFVKSRLALAIFSILNIIGFFLTRKYLFPEDMFLPVVLWLHGGLQVAAMLRFYFRTKSEE